MSDTTAAKILATDNAARKPKAPRMHTVESENLRSVHYSPRLLELSVRFHGDPLTVYKFRNVPVQLYQDFLRAEAAGESLNAFFVARIRDKFPFTKRSKQ
jgi:KTSC domain